MPYLAHAIAALTLGLLGLCACSHESAARPNVLLITLDTTRADALGVYGNPRGTTPNLDRLAGEGTRFDLAISTAAVTPVSHASILTGLDNKSHGLRVLSADSGFRLQSGVPTLASMLREAGYRTLAVHSAFPVSGYFGLDQGFDVFLSFDATMHAGKDGKAIWNVNELQRRSDETTDLVLAELARSPEPWFLWVHYWDPHDGVKLPPAEFLPSGVAAKDDDQVGQSREQYEAEVRYVDREIGRLFDTLRASGAWERTLTAVVADHGEGLGDHGWAFHRLLYQEQIRVPLIVRVPGAQHTPSVSELVRTTDIVPTVLDFARVEDVPAFDGESLRALIEGRASKPRLAFSDQINGYDRNAGMVGKRPLDEFLYSVTEARWKLIYRPAHPEASELYDLASDPGESKNLYAERRDEALRLERELARHGGWVTAPFAATAEDGGAPSDEASAALSKLGYVESELSSSAWAWTCPEHRDFLATSNEKCATCASPLLLTKRPQ